MKILHVAVFIDMSTNVWQANGFENLGHEVIRYDYRQRARDLGNIQKRDDEIIELCKKEKPDVILFSKCNNMDVRAVTECGKIGQTVLWYMDGANNVNGELVQKFKASDHVFCSRWAGVDAASNYNDSVYRLQGGYNPDVHYPFDVPKTIPVAFIGEMRGDRHIYKQKVGFEVITGVYNEEHSKAVSSIMINLSFSEGDGISNRIYKLMTAKGFVLTQPWNRMEDDFEVGKDFDIFTNPTELGEKVDYYLTHQEEREAIVEHAYKTVQSYDNNNYARRILEVVQNG